MSTIPPGSIRLPWTNQQLTLYHGTVQASVASILGSGVDASRGRARTDFGRGIYTTTILRQAQSLAWQLSEREPGALPAIIRFDVDRDALARLDCLCFVRGSFDADDFWCLVHHCRSGGRGHGRTVNQGWYVLDTQVKERFWQVVEDCLEEIHGLPRHDSVARSADLRVRIESPPPGLSSEIFYHAEPFDVACDLARSQKDISQYGDQYERILDRHQW